MNFRRILRKVLNFFRSVFSSFSRVNYTLKKKSKLDLILPPLPKVSIIILTYNNLSLTQKCLDSIAEHTDYPNTELIIVDNASTDGTQQYLTSRFANTLSKIKLIFNQKNSGFAAGNNQGLREASGDYLVILNNDTRVTPHWLTDMVYYFQHHPTLGLLGPVTNNIGNEAKILTRYKNPDDMLPEIEHMMSLQEGKLRPLRTAAFFCVMMPKTVYQAVGELDENFGLGFFEDDDYCRRVEQKGYNICCAEDIFVHHHLSASFNKMGRQSKKALFLKNKKIYESKWGKWQPHEYRQN